MTKTFVKGSSTFICSCCGHNTRWTGEQGVGSKTCPICWDLAGYENMEQDGYMTEADSKQVASIFAELKARSETEYQKALKSFDLIAHYATSEKEQTMTQETIAVIDLANLTVEFFADTIAAAAHADKIDGYQATSAEGLNDLSGPQAVALYNVTAKELDTGLTEVKRFADKQSASKRLWANLVDLAEARQEKAQAAPLKIVKTVDGGTAVIANKARDGAAPAKNSDYPAPASASKPKKVATVKPVAPRRGTGINLAPMAKVYACRAGSKQAILVDILSRPEGATMPELLEALSGGTRPWLEVSVKSGMNWDMNKVKGYGIRTSKRGDEDCYHLVLPQGMTAPVPHTVKKGA